VDFLTREKVTKEERRIEKEGIFKSGLFVFQFKSVFVYVFSSI
jgi:hypothetical protein